MANNFTGYGTSYEPVLRFAPIRLGPNAYIHNEGGHCSKGITHVDVDEDGYLRVYSDFQPGELIGKAVANIDLQLASRGFTAGTSGGGALTKVGIYRDSGTPGKPTRVRADSGGFTSLDNIWFESTSMKPVNL